MPPKGWRKNADGQYPQPIKDSELVSIDEILFPRSTVQKLAKGILNEDDGSNSSNMIIAKDGLIALQRSATVFVSHVMFQAHQLSKADGRKTVNTQDILTSLDKAEFSGFIPEVKEKLAVFEHNQAIKKKQRSGTKTKVVKEEENGVSSKKLKDNSQKPVPVNGKTGDDDEDEDEVVDDDDEIEVVEDEEEQEDDEEVEDDDEEGAGANPIAQLGKEEAELGGADPDKEKENDSENSDEEDE